MSTDANDILMGGGHPTAKFPALGAYVTGTVTAEPEARQQKDYRTGALEFWKDGNPKMMVVAHIATADRDPERADDNGIRTLYIQGKELTNAVREAVRKSGANGIHTGGVLTVQYIGDGMLDAAQIKANMTPPKLYAAHYQPPAVSLNGITGPAAQAVQPQQQAIPQVIPQQVPQQPIPQVIPQVIPQQVQQPVIPQQVMPQQVMPQMIPQVMPQQAAPVTQDTPPVGVSPQMWAGLTQDQRDAVRASIEQPAWANNA